MNLDQLNQIPKLEVPELLFVKIQHRIQEQNFNTLPKAVAITVMASFVLLFVFNISTIIFNYDAKQSTTIAESLGIDNNVTLYSNE